jgi:hypothetical protein
MQYDLLIRNAQFHRHQGLSDIAVKDGGSGKLASAIGSRVLLVLYFREADILVDLIIYETEIFGFD